MCNAYCTFVFWTSTFPSPTFSHYQQFTIFSQHHQSFLFLYFAWVTHCHILQFPDIVLFQSFLPINLDLSLVCLKLLCIPPELPAQVWTLSHHWLLLCSSLLLISSRLPFISLSPIHGAPWFSSAAVHSSCNLSTCYYFWGVQSLLPLYPSDFLLIFEIWALRCWALGIYPKSSSIFPLFNALSTYNP